MVYHQFQNNTPPPPPPPPPPAPASLQMSTFHVIGSNHETGHFSPSHPSDLPVRQRYESVGSISSLNSQPYTTWSPHHLPPPHLYPRSLSASSSSTISSNPIAKERFRQTTFPPRIPSSALEGQSSQLQAIPPALSTLDPGLSQYTPFQYHHYHPHQRVPSGNMSQAAAFHHTIPPPHQQILPATTSTSMHHPEGQHHIQPYAHVHPLLSHQQVLPLVGVQGQEHNMHPHGSDENQQYPSYYANNLSDHHPLQIQQPQQVALYAPNFGNTTTASNLIIPSRPERNSSNTGRTINHSTATVAAQQSRSSFSASAVPPFHHYQQQQQRTPKQKRFYSSDLSKAQFQNKNGILGQNRFNNNNNEPSPFRYNPNRRSSIISNTSNTSEQKNSSSRFNTDNRSRQSISDSRKVNAKETENNVFESASGTSIHEENDWNRVGFDEVAYESVKHSDAEGRGTRDVERHEGGIETTQVYSSISEDPALFSQRTQNQDLHLQQQQQQLHTTLYQPCINPSCSNRFHYTQQVYQPIPSTLDSITSSSSPNYMTLVEIPGIIQAPAWCELKPCGCTICRECFTLVIATCEISIPPSFIDFHTDRPSLDKMSINDRPIRGTTSHDILQAQKKFSCVVCMADCSEFGPINGELQNAVQGAETGTINEDVNASNYDDTLRQDELNKVNFSNIERSNDFDGFQSAQDVALGKTKQRLNNLDHVENAIEEGLSCSSTIISPLLQAEQLADAINRRAKSDSAISVQNSPLFGANNSENDLNATSSSEIKDLTNSIISLQFPTLIRVEEEDKDDNDLTIPSRKVSSSNTATSVNTMSTDIRESPQVYSTPDFAGWSTSSASAASNSSAPSSPITMQSPTFEIRSEGIVMKDAPWRQKALPENHHLIQNIPRVFEDDKILESKTSFSRDSTHQEAKKMHVHVGLGLSFDSMAFVPAPPGAQAEETGVKPHTQSNANSSGNSRPLSPEGSMTRPKRRIPKAKAKEFAGSAASTVAPSVPVDVEKRDQRDNERQTPATPQRSFHSDAPTTPTRALRGRGRGRADSTRGGVTGTGRGRGGYIAAHQARMAEVAHQSSPTRPSGHASFSPIHSRTSTQSSIHTTNTTSVSSSGGTSSPRFFKTYGGRKVSEVENRLSVLPDYLANPTHEQISIWDENKSRWWIDPWLGKPMGVCERIIDGKNIMCGSDGEPLMKGKAAGISWPILKVHNIAFSTTIMDIESFVPPRVLAPLEYNAQGVHLICDLYDGKTRPYAYVECISVEAAEKLIRESDGKYLAGRQVAFRPVTQKELALDLFPNLRKNGYQRDVIVGSSPLRPGSAHHKPQSGQSGTNLELFTEESYQLFKVLFDRILAPPAKHFKTSHNKDDSQDGQADPSPVIFSFPPERPFARLVSMIVKYPHYAKNASNHPIQEYNEEIDRIMKCALYALERLGPHVKSRPQLENIAASLHRAVLQCPAFGETHRSTFLAKWNSLY